MTVEANKQVFTFSTNVLINLRNFIQFKSGSLESGGILLGSIHDDSVAILKLSTPTELDKASRNYFERHRLSAQLIINYEHSNSNGTITYLGEWHTHPEDHPSPSITDIKMISQQFSSNKLNTEFLILLIQGRKSVYFNLITNKGLLKPTIILNDTIDLCI